MRYDDDGRENEVRIISSEESRSAPPPGRAVAPFTPRPAIPDEAGIFSIGRCGDQDRLDALLYVKESHASGHLDEQEYHARSSYITLSKTHEQLVMITSDLGLPLDKWLKNRETIALAERETRERVERRRQERQEEAALVARIKIETVNVQNIPNDGFGQLFSGSVLVAASIIGALISLRPVAFAFFPVFVVAICLLGWGFNLRREHLRQKC